MANQLLKTKRKKKAQMEQQQATMQQAAQAEMAQQQQMMVAQQEQQRIAAETQSKMQIKQAEISFEIEKMNNEAMLKSQLMEKEFAFNMQLKGIEQGQIDKREQAKEKGKSERISQANTQQSKLIEQRKRNLPAVKFESNEDTLDGFDLAEFGPK